MARVQRRHLSGDRHHVGARGIAQRPVFERPADYRRYEKLLRKHLGKFRDRLRLICYCLMTNHIHLLLEASVQVVSEFMRALHQEYVQGFNLARGRSGPLFKRRFWSRPVASIEDLMGTMRYIDQNPVQAGLVTRIGRYPWASAGDYLEDWNTMPLAQDLIQGLLEPVVRRGSTFSNAYSATFGIPMSTRDFNDLTVRHRREWARSKQALERQDFCSPEYRAEMESLARFADGMKVLSRRLAAPSVIQERLLNAPTHAELVSIPVSRKDASASAAQLVEIALLKEACCLTFSEIGNLLGISSSLACTRHAKHRAWLEDEEDGYSQLAQGALTSVLGDGANNVNGAWPQWSG